MFLPRQMWHCHAGRGALYSRGHNCGALLIRIDSVGLRQAVEFASLGQRNTVSNPRRQQQLRIRSRFSEEPMSLASLHGAERLFAELAVRMLLRNAQEPESTGLRLRRRDRGGAYPSGERPGHK